MANTFELISSVTVGAGGAASIDFTSIPSTYTDLCIKTSARANNAANDNGLIITFNGSTTGYSDRTVYGNGSSAASGGPSGVAGLFWYYADAANSTSNTFANGEFYIPNYAGSNNKSVSMDSVVENNATAALALLSAGLWSNSAAINRVTITPSSSALLVQYSTAYLYGVKNA